MNHRILSLLWPAILLAGGGNSLTAQQTPPGSDPPENPVSYQPPPQNRILAVTERNCGREAADRACRSAGSFLEASYPSSLHWCLESPSVSLVPKAVGGIGGESAQAVPTPG